MRSEDRETKEFHLDRSDKAVSEETASSQMLEGDWEAWQVKRRSAHPWERDFRLFSARPCAKDKPKTTLSVPLHKVQLLLA